MIADVPAHGHHVVVLFGIERVHQRVDGLRGIIAVLNQRDVVAVLLLSGLRGAPAHVGQTKVADIRAVIEHRFAFARLRGFRLCKGEQTHASNQNQSDCQYLFHVSPPVSVLCSIPTPLRCQYRFVRKCSFVVQFLPSRSFRKQNEHFCISDIPFLIFLDSSIYFSRFVCFQPSICLNMPAICIAARSLSCVL
ncbi:MAG: hypothetical protein PHY12_11280 [Eubacteriales bacterium]|nr:hypothetical protein [Eubacteriales bacterium]